MSKDSRIGAKVSKLRKLLLTAQDLDEVSEYFHEELVPDDAFISSGTRTSNPRLLTALEAVLERVTKGGKLGTPLLIRLAEHALCHGYSTWGAGHVVFFYFEQLELGFCSYSPDLRSTEVSLLRFNLMNVTGVGVCATGQSVPEAARKSGPR